MAEGEGAVQDVAAESSTATEQVADPSQATTQPGSTNGQPAPQYVPLDRFQQYVRQVQDARPILARVPQLEQKLQEAETRLAEYEKKASQGSTSPEDDEEVRKAMGALERIFMRSPEALDRILSQHPKFKALAENSDKLLASQTGVQQMQQAQSQALMRQATSHIHGLAEKAGLPQTPKYLQSLVRLVAAEAQQIEGGNQRFSQGDLTVLEEAFKALQTDFLAHTQRAGTAGLLQTKNATRSLPPAPRGGAAGPPGLPKFDPAKQTVQDRMNDLRKASAAMLDEGSKE